MIHLHLNDFLDMIHLFYVILFCTSHLFSCMILYTWLMCSFMCEFFTYSPIFICDSLHMICLFSHAILSTIHLFSCVILYTWFSCHVWFFKHNSYIFYVWFFLNDSFIFMCISDHSSCIFVWLFIYDSFISHVWFFTKMVHLFSCGAAQWCSS